ncbi:T-cell surface glycoprotein CD8 alpha chain-like isoform X2 [Gallus gallus]|uniref:T-cell surface glycoprotein CD8 alpha chain-like isoform X2 n=1 Tax=Gallus gallus TaxID=9031 RepID=UPI001AE9DDEF|nr:T-cell surface glycoprotein CD8 alpha chain-like isoform X2 [Gallus gallus]
MAGSPALLLLLSLGLCCTSTQAQKNMMEARFLDRNMKNPQEGQRLELECLHYERNRPVFWIRLDKSENLHFIAYSTHSYSTTLQEGEKTSPNFVALWRGNSYRLVVKSFRAQDEGIYYCINYINPVLHFSSGQPAFFPAEHITPAATIQSSQVTTKDNSQQDQDAGTSNENALHFCYDVVIWVNLAGACLLLLTAITITITHCQRTSKEITQNSICNVFLWVRVAGTCFLILTTITITIMHCQRPSSP